MTAGAWDTRLAPVSQAEGELPFTVEQTDNMVAVADRQVMVMALIRSVVVNASARPDEFVVLQLLIVPLYVGPV